LARARRAFPNLPIAADGWLDRTEKDPDEATVISSGFGRDFSGEKEHLVLGGPGHPGEWHLIWHADGQAATGRRRSG
jgi:hypothetical protein